MSNDLNDNVLFDVDSTRPQPRLTANPAVRAQQLANERLRQEQQRQAQVLYLQLLTQDGVVTHVTTPTNGNDIDDEYTALYKNDTNNPVRVQVFADLVTPGCGAVLSTNSDRSNSGKFDALTLTANGRVESVSVIVLPTMAVWAREFNTAFPMSGSDVLRVRVFDPAKLISYANLYPQQKGF